MELRPPGLSPWSVASNSCGHHRDKRSDTGRVQTRNSCREAAPGTTHGVTSCAPLLPRGGETTGIPGGFHRPERTSAGLINGEAMTSLVGCIEAKRKCTAPQRPRCITCTAPSAQGGPPQGPNGPQTAPSAAPRLPITGHPGRPKILIHKSRFTQRPPVNCRSNPRHGESGQVLPRGRATLSGVLGPAENWPEKRGYS